MNGKLKQATRQIKIIRLLAVVQAYSAYKMMTLHSQLMSIKNDWQSAERMCDMMQWLFPMIEHHTEDFFHNEAENADKALDYYEQHKHWLNFAEQVCIPKETLTAFCKNVENGQSVFWLKAFGHLYYGEWLMALSDYLNGKITKEDLHKILVEYSLFTGKSSPANMAHFRRDMAEIERVITEIQSKQLVRELQKR